MKNKIALALFVASMAATGVSQATTITAGGGSLSDYFVTSANTNTILTNSQVSIQVGSYVGNVFTQFGALDATPIVLVTTTGILQNKWSAGYTDNNSVTATPFNGLQVWFKVTTTADGGGTAYFSQSGQNFPISANGVGDTLAISNQNFNTVGGTSSTGSAITAGKLVVGVVPEPSAALLGALGVLGLLRRRRN